jgi:hypothetical protein
MNDAGDDLQQETWSAVLEKQLRWCEKQFFQEISPPVSELRIVVETADYPARYQRNDNSIEINAAVARFPQLTKLLIVHELVHHKLYVKDPNYIPYGLEYLKEIRALCNHDSYLKLR